jgi:hypothetical protein
MGFDIHLHDHYIAVGHVPVAVVLTVLVLAALFGAWKLAKFIWLMLAG